MKKQNSIWVLLPAILAGFLILASFQKRNEANQQSEISIDEVYKGIEFNMPKVNETKFPDYSVSIADFGAVADGKTKNTKAITDAINAVSAKGGGKVIIPRGVWVTGPIYLKSNINLHTEAGALIIFSSDFDDYPLLQTSFEGLNTFRCVSPIMGHNLENIAITGKGIFDGSGDAWRPVKRSKMTDAQWKNLVSSGGVLSADGKTWYPSEQSKMGAERSSANFNVPLDLKTKEDHEKIKDFLRPVMLSIVKSKRVLLDGPTFQNSPAWNLHPLMCEDIILRNLTVRNPWYSQNGDGLDLESCKNALVYNCSFDVGDDAICFKSGKDKDGRDRGIPTENVIVKNCVVYHGHGGFVVGSEMSGGVKNVHISNCTFIGTDVGLRFKSTRGRGGVVENIWISNIDMMNIPAEPILFDLYYGGNSPIPTAEEKVVDKEKLAASVPAVTEETPQFKNISVKNVICNGAGRAIFLQGLPEMNLQNISLENIKIDGANKGFYLIDANGIQVKNVTVTSKEILAMYLKNAKNITIEGFNKMSGSKEVVKVEGALSENINFRKADFANAEQAIVKTADVKKNAVKIK